eukprot:g19702.t1
MTGISEDGLPTYECPECDQPVEEGPNGLYVCDCGKRFNIRNIVPAAKVVPQPAPAGKYLACPSCRVDLIFTDKSGDQGTCPKCHQEYVLPDVEETPLTSWKCPKCRNNMQPPSNPLHKIHCYKCYSRFKNPTMTPEQEAVYRQREEERLAKAKAEEEARNGPIYKPDPEKAAKAQARFEKMRASKAQKA